MIVILTQEDRDQLAEAVRDELKAGSEVRVVVEDILERRQSRGSPNVSEGLIDLLSTAVISIAAEAVRRIEAVGE